MADPQAFDGSPGDTLAGVTSVAAGSASVHPALWFANGAVTTLPARNDDTSTPCTPDTHRPGAGRRDHAGHGPGSVEVAKRGNWYL